MSEDVITGRLVAAWLERGAPLGAVYTSGLEVIERVLDATGASSRRAGEYGYAAGPAWGAYDLAVVALGRERWREPIPALAVALHVREMVAHAHGGCSWACPVDGVRLYPYADRDHPDRYGCPLCGGRWDRCVNRNGVAWWAGSLAWYTPIALPIQD